MTSSEAIELIAPAVGLEATTWLDLGAGSGTFTEALAHVLGPGGAVVAVDNDRAAVDALRARAERLPEDTASVVAVRGDIADLASSRELDGLEIRGALLANVLHFFRDPEPILRSVAALLARPGRLAVIEYARAAPNPWVPYPLSVEALDDIAAAAGFGAARVVAERPSRFGGTLYCAVLPAR